MKREPLFNIPPVIIALLAALAFVHGFRTLVLSDDLNIEFLLTFAFIPARYDTSVVLGGALPGGFGAEIWTFVTYSLIHADWTHFGVNAVWLLPFGSALARRFGAVRFLLFFAVTAAAGAAMHLATHPGAEFPVIGASAAISGAMAAAMRFAFQRGGPLNMLRGADSDAYRVPAIPLSGVLRDARVLIFSASGSASIFCSVTGRCRLPAAISRSPGRRISAAFSRACCCFPGSIRRRALCRPTKLLQRKIRICTTLYKAADDCS